MKNLNEINMIRAIACIFVVLTHSITNYLRNVEVDMSDGDRYIIWIRFAVLCATPIFILLSEALIAKNYPSALPKGFFKRRFKYILLPYVFIGTIVSYRESVMNSKPFMDLFIDKIILGDWYGFFILVIFQFYFLHWLIGRYLKKMYPVYPLLISFIISFLHTYLVEHNAEYSEFILTYYPLSERTNILLWIFYFVVAFYTGQYYERIITFLNNKIWLPLSATVIAYLLVMNNVLNKEYTMVASERYDMMIYAVSIFFLMLVLFRKYEISTPILMMISHFSFFIYLTHLLFLSQIALFAFSFGESFFINISITTFLTIATSIGWAFLFYQNKYTRLLTGKIRYIEKVYKVKRSA